MSSLPLTSGFYGKLLILKTSIASSSSQGNSLFLVLAFFIVFNAAISAWYYLGVLTRVFLRLPLGPQAKPISPLPLCAAVACSIATLAGGIVPGLIEPYLRPVEKATAKSGAVDATVVVTANGFAGAIEQAPE